MDIKTASEKFGVSEKAVVSYIAKGYIDCLSCEGNMLLLPDIPKLYMKNLNKACDDEKRMKTILKACSKHEYLSAYMLNITSEHFELLIDNLVKAGYLEGEATSGASNMGYNITAKAIDVNSPKFKLEINVGSINLEGKLEGKIALINL